MANADPSFFDSIGGDISSAKQSILGPSYDYVGNIRLPSEIGMSSAGTLKALGKDIDGLAAYLQLLVSGGGSASKAKGPMGNKFFLQTGAKCMGSYDINGNAVANPVEQSRYIYINNVPAGHIPLISSGVNANFSDFRGLVPGVIEDLNSFNPISMFTALTGGMTPDCRPLQMEVIGDNNKVTYDKKYITDTDIETMDPCWFIADSKKKKYNPITKDMCRMTFTNMDGTSSGMEAIIPDDIVSQGIFASLGALAVYIAFKGMQRMHLIPK